MKRLIPTILALIILVVGFLYAKSQDFFREPQMEGLPLVEMQLNEVDAIYLKNEEEEISITRTEEGWVIQDNPTYPLDVGKIDDWLVDLLTATDDGVIDEAPENLTEFGLAPPVSELGITLADGTEQIIHIGNEMPVQGHHYMTKSEDSKLYQIKNETLNTLLRDKLYFTNKRVMPYNLSGIHSITYTLGDQQWRLERQGDADASFNAPWKLEEYDRQYSDISSILGQTIYMSTEELPISISDMTMDNVHLQITVEEYVDGELVEHVVFGEVKDEQTVLLWEMNTFWGYKIKIEDLEELFVTGLEAIETAKAELENAEAEEAATADEQNTTNND